MRFTKVSLVAGIAALALVGFTFHQSALKVTAKQGDVRKYKLTADMTLAGMEATLTGSVSDKVTKVDDKGNITTVSNQTNMQVEFNGSPMQLPDSSSTNVMRPDGTTMEIRSETVGPSDYRIATVSTLKLPDFPLEKDKTWTWDCPADEKTGVVKAKGEYKVLGDEKVHDIDTWKISAKVSEVDGDTPATMETTAWINKADGTLVKSEGKGANLPFPGAPGPVSGTMKIELVS